MPPLGSKVKLKFRGKDREIRIHVYRPTVTMASIVISDSDSDTESAIPPISVNISAIPSSVTEAKRSPIKKRRRNQKSSEDEVCAYLSVHTIRYYFSYTPAVLVLL